MLLCAAGWQGLTAPCGTRVASGLRWVTRAVACQRGYWRGGYEKGAWMGRGCDGMA